MSDVAYQRGKETDDDGVPSSKAENDNIRANVIGRGAIEVHYREQTGYRDLKGKSRELVVEDVPLFERVFVEVLSDLQDSSFLIERNLKGSVFFPHY